MSIRNSIATLALALALGLSAAAVAGPFAAPAKFKDVLMAFKGKEVMVANSSKAGEAKPRKLVIVGDDYLAVELPDGRRNYFPYARVASVQVGADGAANIFLGD